MYNLADMVNKIAFCLAIWACAKADTAAADHRIQLPSVRHGTHQPA